jgi:hypothetical protein
MNSGKPRPSASFYLLRTAAVILFLTGFLKIFSGFGDVKLLGQANPLIWFLTNRQMLFVAALIELAVGTILVCRVNRLLQVSWLVSLANVFLVYRVGLWWIGYKGSCACLGHLSDWLRIKPETADWISQGALAYMLIVGYSLLLSSWVNKAASRTAPQGNPIDHRVFND